MMVAANRIERKMEGGRWTTGAHLELNLQGNAMQRRKKERRSGHGKNGLMMVAANREERRMG